MKTKQRFPAWGTIVLLVILAGCSNNLSTQIKTLEDEAANSPSMMLTYTKHQDSTESSMNAGDTVDYGTVAQDTSAEIVFTIINEGDADLELTGSVPVSVSGTQYISLDEQPAQVVIPPDGSVSFSISFSPDKEMDVTAYAAIDTNDPDHSKYRFSLTGRA